MASIVLGLSFQTEAGPLPAHEHHRVTDAAPSGPLAAMTTIFRLAFRATFSDIRTFRVPRRRARMAGASVKVCHCASYRTLTADIHGRSAPDYLLVVVLEFSPGERGVDAARAWQSFRTLESKMSLLERCGLKNLLEMYSPASGRLVGQNSLVVPDELAPDPRMLSSVFAFYFLAWLICLRIERSQLQTELGVGPASLRTSGWRIAGQRLRILNFSRFFLTEDRTNDATLRAVCVALSTKFKLMSRYERALSLHRDFEHHLDNVSKIVNSQQLGSVSNLLLILTLLSVPLAFLGAIVAVNLQGDVFTSPGRVFSDHRIYLLLGVGFAGSLVPFVLLKIHDLIRRRR